MEQAPVPAVPEADPSAAGGASPETGSSGASTTDSPPEAVAVPAQTEDPAAAPVAALTPAAEAGDAATAAAPPVPSPAPEAALPAPAGPSGPGGPPIDGDDAEEDEDGGGGKMSFLDHLDELRTRLITSFGALAVGFVVCFGFIEPIFDFIMVPMTAVLEEGASLLQRTGPEMFFLRLKMAALVGLLLATPVTMSQVWLFVAPGLYAHEKRFAIPFVVFASLFFIVGALFGHYVLFRVAWDFFASFAADTDYVTFLPALQESFSLYVRLVLACGVVFQLPTVVFFLARMGVASPAFLIRNFKYAFLLCFVFAAILTPTPDPVTMTVMAGPMIALYLLSIGIAWVFRKRTPD
jgi:sec-independent protein translocase protein TatC